MEVKFVKVIKNDLINLDVNVGYGYSVILSIDKKMTKEELKLYTEENYKDITSLIVDPIINAEQTNSNFGEYLNDVFGLDIDDEEAIDDYRSMMVDAFYETLSENSNIVIEKSNDNHTEFLIY